MQGCMIQIMQMCESNLRASWKMGISYASFDSNQSKVRFKLYLVMHMYVYPLAPFSIFLLFFNERERECATQDRKTQKSVRNHKP